MMPSTKVDLKSPMEAKLLTNQLFAVSGKRYDAQKVESERVG